MPSRYPEELDAIVAARKADPKVGAKTLAKQLYADNGLGGSLMGRTFYSIYSVIRRYDAKQKANAKLAKTVGNALASY